MHVAICDDNVADRKHLERLLSREADKRAGSSDNLFIESFGHKNQFLQNPLKYNMVFMDMCSEDGLVEEIFKALEPMGYSAPTVLYSSKIDYTQIKNLPEYVIHCTKPYVSTPLPGFLEIGANHASEIVPTITIHKDGIYSKIAKDDIAYAFTQPHKNIIHLEDGETLEVDEDISVIRRLLEPYREFVRVNKKSIVNFKYFQKNLHLMIIMHNKKKFFVSPAYYSEVKYQYEYFLTQQYNKKS